MAYIEVLGQDLTTPPNVFPVPQLVPGLKALVKQTHMGEILDFPLADNIHFCVPTGVEGQYRPIRVYGGLSMAWDHELRDFLLKENLDYLRGFPLPSCLTIEIVPDTEWEQREAEARRVREEKAAARRRTNQRQTQRAALAAAQLAAAQLAANPQPAAPAPVAPVPPVPAFGVPDLGALDLGVPDVGHLDLVCLVLTALILVCPLLPLDLGVPDVGHLDLGMPAPVAPAPPAPAFGVPDLGAV
ncbi:hypothetical protein QC760_003348 [Botrytis cinerea]